MNQYYRQTDGFRCGPISVMNALRWAGCDYPFSYFKEELDVDSLAPYTPRGTCQEDMDYMLNRWADYSQLFGVVKFHSRPSLKLLDGIIRKGNSAVIHYAWELSNHYSLAFQRTPCFYYIANHYTIPGNKKAVHKVSRRSLSKDLRFDRSESWFWEIEKRNTK